MKENLFCYQGFIPSWEIFDWSAKTVYSSGPIIGQGCLWLFTLYFCLGFMTLIRSTISGTLEVCLRLQTLWYRSKYVILGYSICMSRMFNCTDCRSISLEIFSGQFWNNCLLIIRTNRCTHGRGWYSPCVVTGVGLSPVTLGTCSTPRWANTPEGQSLSWRILDLALVGGGQAASYSIASFVAPLINLGKGVLKIMP